MKKIFSLFLAILLVFSLTACGEDINLTIDATDINLVDGDEYTIIFSTNDDKTPEFVTSDESVISVDSLGVVTAMGEGSATITVTSKGDSSLVIELTFTVSKLITITSNDTSIDLVEGDTHVVGIESNDGYTYSSSNTDIFVINEHGLITAKAEGSAELVVTSTYDDSYVLTIPVNVSKVISLEIEQTIYAIIVGLTRNIDAVSNDDLIYVSSDPSVVSINESGTFLTRTQGEAIITVTSVSDPTISIEVRIMVFGIATEIGIIGDELMAVGTTQELQFTTVPSGSYFHATIESTDNSILTINEFAEIVAVGTGIASIIVTYTQDEEITAVLTIEVINVALVNEFAEAGDTYMFMGIELVYGEKLFSNINDAIASAVPYTTIYLDEGSFTEDVTVNVEGITLEGLTNVTFEGLININADDVTIKNINFSGNSLIVNTTQIDNFSFNNNNVDSLTSTEGSFLDLYTVSNVYIEDNLFANLNVNAINIENFVSGKILIKNNVIDNVLNGITVKAQNEYDITSEINIMWNTITDVATGINIDLMYGVDQLQIEAYARFNSVSGYTIAASSNVGNQVDFTLNHWGSGDMDYSKFINIEEDMLIGNYDLDTDILSEELYDPEVPIAIIITNRVTELTIGDEYTIEFTVLPLDLDTSLITYIISNPDVLGINANGDLFPLRSGTCTVTVKSKIDSSVNTTMTIDIITTPGIELTPTNIINNNGVGSTFTLDATPFPIGLVNEAVNYVSSNIEVATIDASGLVTTTGEGVVTFTASLQSDPLVTQTFTMNVYGTLDEDNLLDYLTINQVSYSTMHEWTAYGFAFNYYDTRYESVSRYYFDNVVINDSKIVPVSYGIRPGEPMDILPDGVTQYNDKNIYWVVVHDTASTASGSGALAHANYLYNNAVAGNQLWVSWHYTIDDTYIYQSLPEDERGYHAGDGSSQPLQGVTYLGGGNRNGVGIEMSINEDGDMYRTWQRTAKLVVDILYRNNLPLENQMYHNDFSGKDCPNTLRNAGLIPLFETFLDVEFKVKTEHPDATIIFSSNDPDYLDDYGRIINMPDEAMTVSYTITVTEDGVTESRTFYTYLPGTIH